MRPTTKRCIKAIFFFSTLFFLLMNLNFFLRGGNNNGDTDTTVLSTDSVLLTGDKNVSDLQSKVFAPPRLLSMSSASGQFDRVEIMSHLNEARTLRNASRLNQTETVFTDTFVLPRNANISEIRRITWDANRRQTIRNLDKFDVPASDTTIVIVVQVLYCNMYRYYLYNYRYFGIYIFSKLLFGERW